MRIAQVAPLYESVPPKLYGGTERIVSYLTEQLVRQKQNVTLFASGDSVTNARLIPITERALRLEGSRIRDPLAHHIRLVERVLREADQFDILHFHLDHLHFPLVRRSQSVCVTSLHGRLDIPDLAPLFQEFSEMPVVSISDSQREPLSWLNWCGTIYHGLPEDLYDFVETPGDYPHNGLAGVAFDGLGFMYIGLGETDEMRRGKDLHGGLQPDWHGLHRRRGTGQHLQDDEDGDHEEAELPHRGRECGEQNAH